MESNSLLENKTMVEKEMMEVSFDYWFNDHDDIRSPIPDYIKSELRDKATESFEKWASKLTNLAKKEINDEILLERFEEVMFEEAIKLVQTEEERITIKYPFMHRIDDHVKDGVHPESKVVKRVIISENDTAFLNVTFCEIETGKVWETNFEVPE